MKGPETRPDFEQVTRCSYRERRRLLKARFRTTLGDFTVKLYPRKCPETVWNFVNLAEGRQPVADGEGPFFDGLPFHKVSELAVHSGCPLHNGMGGPGYRFEDEIVPGLRHDRAGTLSMANAGPGTNGSQFFLTLAPAPFLDGRHTVFGHVVSGHGVVQAIGSVWTDENARPRSDVLIEKVVILRGIF